MNAPSPNPPLAAILTILASAFVAGTTLLAKALGTGVLGPEMNALQISQGRFLFAFLGIGMAALIMQPKISRPNLGLHITRSSLGWGGVTLMFAAAAFIPLSDAMAISFLNPVFGMIFAILFLRESVGPWRWVSAVIALCGAMILMRPGMGTLQVGALVALASAAALGAELIPIKLLTRKERPFQILLVNNVIGLIIASIAASFIWIWPTPQQWMALAGIGGLMALAQTCFINAMARADASFASPFFYTSLVFAAFYDAALFNVIPDNISLIGTTLILIGAAILLWRETRARKANS